MLPSDFKIPISFILSVTWIFIVDAKPITPTIIVNMAPVTKKLDEGLAEEEVSELEDIREAMGIPRIRISDLEDEMKIEEKKELLDKLDKLISLAETALGNQS